MHSRNFLPFVISVMYGKDALKDIKVMCHFPSRRNIQNINFFTLTLYCNVFSIFTGKKEENFDAVYWDGSCSNLEFSLFIFLFYKLCQTQSKYYFHVQQIHLEEMNKDFTK